MSWRDEPITEKQKQLIMEMNEFSEFPLPAFSGTTKGEASDYINKNLKQAHERLTQTKTIMEIKIKEEREK